MDAGRQDETCDKQMINRASVASRRCTMRVIHDDVAQMLLVYEADPILADVGGQELVFETHKSSVRVREYPQNWRNLSDKELRALMGR